MSALSFRTFTLVNVVEEFLLQHPLEIFSHFPSLTLDRANFLVDRNRPLAILVCPLRKVCCRYSRAQTDAVHPSVVNQLLPECLQRPRVLASTFGEYIAAAIVFFRPINRSVFSCQQCRQPRDCSSPVSFLPAQIPAHHHHQLTPNASDTSGTKCAPPPFTNSRISEMHQPNACTGWSCKKCLTMIHCL